MNGKTIGEIASPVQQPNLPLRPWFLTAGPAGIRTAVLFPSWHEPGTKLPVLMDPYGGPGRAAGAQGHRVFPRRAVVRGTEVRRRDRGRLRHAGRGPAWDRTTAGDFATGILEDQVTALHTAVAYFAHLAREFGEQVLDQAATRPA